MYIHLICFIILFTLSVLVCVKFWQTRNNLFHFLSHIIPSLTIVYAYVLFCNPQELKNSISGSQLTKEPIELKEVIIQADSTLAHKAHSSAILREDNHLHENINFLVDNGEDHTYQFITFDENKHKLKREGFKIDSIEANPGYYIISW